MTRCVTDAEELLHLAKRTFPEDSPLVAYLTTVGYVLHARRRIIEGLKEGWMDPRVAARLNSECDLLMIRKRELPPELPECLAKEPTRVEIEEFVTEHPSLRRGLVEDSSVRNGNSANVSEPVDASVAIENEMLEMTAGMRDVAHSVRRSIQRDVHVLGLTSELQQANLDQTVRQNVEAKSLRSGKRLSIFVTMLMILASVVIFLALIPLMIVT